MSSDFTFYFGCASGSSRKALRKAEEDNVMINYCTKTNKPWNNIKNLFIDSGGYSFIKNKGEYTKSNKEYIDYILEYEPKLFALRDYPCEPDLLKKLDRNVKNHQELTTEKHRELLDLYDIYAPYIDSKPVSIIQGYKVNQYLDHYDSLRENGLITDYCAIGSLCGRRKVKKIRNIVTTLRKEIPSKIKLHGFGVKKSSFKYPSIIDSLDSSDSLAWDSGGSNVPEFDRISGCKRYSWLESFHRYLHLKKEINTIINTDKEQTNMGSYI